VAFLNNILNLHQDEQQQQQQQQLITASNAVSFNVFKKKSYFSSLEF